MSPTVGVIGGGQLARMMIPPAVALGIEIRVLAEVEGSSAALAASAVGDYTDIETVLRFAEGVDVITFDHEHVPTPVLEALAAKGIAVHPSAAALRPGSAHAGPAPHAPRIAPPARQACQRW